MISGRSSRDADLDPRPRGRFPRAAAERPLRLDSVATHGAMTAVHRHRQLSTVSTGNFCTRSSKPRRRGSPATVPVPWASPKTARQVACLSPSRGELELEALLVVSNDVPHAENLPLVLHLGALPKVLGGCGARDKDEFIGVGGKAILRVLCARACKCVD